MGVGQLAALGAVGVEVVADRKQAGRLGVAESLQALVLLHRQGGDVLLDVWVGVPMDEWNAGCVPYEPERGAVFDAVSMRLLLRRSGEARAVVVCEEGPVAAHIARPGAMDGPERPSERLGRAVPVPTAMLSRSSSPPDDITGRNGHPSATQ